MSGPDVSSWKSVGATSNADCYEVEPGILAIVPRPSSKDDEASARESIRFQKDHWTKSGRRGGVAVYMDAILSLDKGARRVYATEVPASLSTCYALIVESFFAHALASVFTGLSKPPLPTAVFRSMEEARPWINQINRERGGPTT